MAKIRTEPQGSDTIRIHAKKTENTSHGSESGQIHHHSFSVVLGRFVAEGSRYLAFGSGVLEFMVWGFGAFPK